MVKKLSWVVLILLLSSCSSGDDNADLDVETDASNEDEEVIVPMSGGGESVSTDDEGPTAPVPDTQLIEPSGPNNTNLFGTIQLLSIPERVGLITTSDDAIFSDVSATGYFLNWPVANGTDVSSLLPPNAVTIGDTCSVTAIDIENDLTLSDFLQDTFELISAGESITLTSEAGTYGSLGIQQISNEDVFYFSLSDLPFPSPESLVFSIPGDEFLANTAQATSPEAIEGFSIAIDTTIQESETLSWIASSNNDTLLSLSFIDANPIPLFTAECVLVDDGEFILPASLHIDAAAITGESPIIRIDAASRLLLGLSNDGLPSDALIHVRSVGLSVN